jgi:hypothetical protein
MRFIDVHVELQGIISIDNTEFVNILVEGEI